MEYAIRGDVEGGPALHLDYEEFEYAGKFNMTNAGKAVVIEDETTVGALSFNRDRTDDSTAWIRYVTVRRGHRGEGIGARLAAFVAEHLLVDFRSVRIAVNNPFAYEALYKAKFGYTGERTGLAEVVLERPHDTSDSTYRNGLQTFQDRDLSETERSFVAARIDSGAPDPVCSD